ncbi:MarR family winged helix-turn-helix transcriptional regulator [Streptomyces sp. NPDC057694]|uniref:MarR family winged helix-turn-helix transcriptional regulator n=1 Tax=Streptomyces sp. NPDC057694 TaxID=3346216 RepID=UPI0036CEF131
MPQSLPFRTPEQVAQVACGVSELLEVLWGRGQAAALAGPLPPSQFRALTVIEGQKRVNQRTLGEALGSRPSSVSRLCDRLEAAGLVERVASPTSRREVDLRLSRRGAAVLEEFRTSRARELESVLRSMAPAELSTLVEGLEQFQEAAAAHIGLNDAASGPEEVSEATA